MAENNPFSALFAPIDQLPVKIEQETNNKFDQRARQIFKLTLKFPDSKENRDNLYHLKDLAEALDRQTFDRQALEQAVLEYLVGLKSSLVDYLNDCYDRIVKEDEPAMLEIICSNLDLAFFQPELFPDQKLADDFVRLLATRPSNFFDDFVRHCQQNPSATNFDHFMSTLLREIQNQLTNRHLFIGNRNAMDAMLVLSRNGSAAEVLVSSSILNTENSAGINGKRAETTVLGSLFICSCLPRMPGGRSDFFDRPSATPSSVLSKMEGDIWSASEANAKIVYQIFYNLMKVSPKVQHLTRTWIGNFSGQIFKYLKFFSRIFRRNFEKWQLCR